MSKLNFEQNLTGKRILITGHNGFTGSWLSLWLTSIGAKVFGLSLVPITSPSMSQSVNLEALVDNNIGDICDFDLVRELLAKTKPEIVFHLAAQPLVRRSYAEPLATYATNVMGTANVLEAARQTQSVKAFVCVTTDKVYADDGHGVPHMEDGRLGGADPYSASKAAAEIVASSYQQTMSSLGNGMAIATVRGGNIIGGGDWSEDRLIPDFIRAWRNNLPLIIRAPEATRPWQHVLSACHGYMAVASHLLDLKSVNGGSWNIGPAVGETLNVGRVVEVLAQHCQSPLVKYEPSHLKETHFLSLDTNKASEVLAFTPPWQTEEVLAKTAQWYREFYESNEKTAHAITVKQIEEYRLASFSR